MSDYKPGSATASYRNSVNKAAQMVEQQKARVSAFYHDKLDALLNSYARRLAQWTNDYNRNQASYPSQFIAGAGNFNMRKHNRQMSREDSLWRNTGRLRRFWTRSAASAPARWIWQTPTPAKCSPSA